MMKSVRIQLLILVFAVVLPAFGIIIYSGYERQRHDVETTKADALIMAQVLGNDHENDVEATRRFLMTLARLPVLQTGMPLPATSCFVNCSGTTLSTPPSTRRIVTEECMPTHFPSAASV